jgi:uncharacterized protein YecE (DUF72 family)
MRVVAGTSGFSYKEWQGSFYPEKHPASRMLEFYAERLPTVELNNTFYRMPGEALVQGWQDKSPEHFRFVLKAPRSMTHSRKLVDCAESVARFVSVSSRLGAKLGPMLFQLPPFFQKDTARLDAFLGGLPKGVRAAFEFRHPSWFDEATFAVLRSHDTALCTADVDDVEPPPIVPTASFGYLRLRRLDYTPEQITGWAEQVRRQPFEEAYVFFKHELEAPARATAFNAHFPSQGESPVIPSPATPS